MGDCDCSGRGPGLEIGHENFAFVRRNLYGWVMAYLERKMTPEQIGGWQRKKR
jgi:hypothetical protein